MQYFFRKLETGVDSVKRLIGPFAESIGLTGFAYVRIYDEARVSWVTSVPEHDRRLVESGSLAEECLIDTKPALKEGPYLWFGDHCPSFYKERKKQFKIDHGLVVVQHQKGYVETCCFSAHLAKAPLYNLFMRKQGLFKSFMDHFKSQLGRQLLQILNEGFHLGDIKKSYGVQQEEIDQKMLVALCGASELLGLSRRELECLANLRQGLTYEGIGRSLKLSARTVEHYLTSVKNKLGLESHYELCQLSHKLYELGLFPVFAKP